MAFHANAGRIYVTNTTGDVVFDTQEKLFTATDFVTGSVSLGPWTAQTRSGAELSFHDVETNHALGTVNAAADTVRGAFYVSTSGGTQGLSGIGWFNASGSYVHAQLPGGPVGTLAGSAGIYSMSAFTFFASGGQLYLKERVVHRAPTSLTTTTFTSTLLAVTLDYQLFAGTFV